MICFIVKFLILILLVPVDARDACSSNIYSNAGRYQNNILVDYVRSSCVRQMNNCVLQIQRLISNTASFKQVQIH